MRPHLIQNQVLVHIFGHQTTTETHQQSYLDVYILHQT